MPSKGEPILFGEFTLSWLATWAIVRFKPSGYTEYESICRLHLLPAFGELPLSEVSPQRIQAYIAEKLGAGMSPRSVKNHIIVLKGIFATAIDYRILTENPTDKVIMPRIERSEMSYLTPDQLRRLIEATPDSWKLLIALPALCGLRKGELLALTWDDIDLDAMTVSITKSMRGGIVSTPKTAGSVSNVPLAESLSLYAARRRSRTRGHKLVFCRSDGSPLSDTLPNRVLSKALSAAGLPSIRFHDLRHSWAVAHLKAGTDIKTLAYLGRWSSTTTLLETYAHVLPAMGGDAVKRLDSLVNNQEG